jgi:hypothetical protein
MLLLAPIMISLITQSPKCEWVATIKESYHDRESAIEMTIDSENIEFTTSSLNAACAVKRWMDSDFSGWVLFCDYKNFTIILPGLERKKAPPIEGDSVLIADDGTQVFARMNCRRLVARPSLVPIE